MRKSYFVISTVILFVSVFSVFNGYSQATIPIDSIRSMLIKDWERAKAYTQDYMKAMPASKYSFRANDSVRTFAQQLLHITQANMFLISVATGDKPSFAADLEKSKTAQTADSVMYYVDKSYDFAINAIKNLPATSFSETSTFNMGQAISATRFSWLLKAFEHQTHHRGQTTIYLRLAGVRPPNERLF